MSSRIVLRRLSHVSRRLQMASSVGIRSFSASSRAIQHKPVTPCQNYCQMRMMCSKPGDGMIINIQDEKDFEERVVNSSKPVVVDFHASWCGPCKLLGPRLEALVGAQKGNVILAKIDVDDHLELASKFQINSVPTVLAFKNKELQAKFVGLQDDDIIETFLNRLMG